MTTEIQKSETKNLIFKSVLLVVLLKCIYIILEYFYNLHIFDVASSKDFLNVNIVNDLNENGHQISSIGITLILTPILYIFIKNIKSELKTFLYVIIPIIIYFSAYFSLNKLVDVIVEQNKDKRYEAYYLNIFKIGLLHNKFQYDSFIDSEKIKNDNLSVDDKLLFLNTFLLLHANENFIETLIAKGKASFPSIYIKQFKASFDEDFNKYLVFDEEVRKNYEEFKSAKIKLSDVIKDIESKYDDNQIKKEFNDMDKKINSSYNSNSSKNKVKANIDVEETYSLLNSYFKNRGNSTAEKRYKKEIYENFHKYIPPERWLGDDGKLSRYKIKEVIEEESSASSNISSVEDFKSTPEVRKKIISELKNKGLKNINENVDYTTYSNFYNLIKNNVELNKKSAIEEFKNQLNRKIGKNDLSASMGWNEFLASSFLKNIIKEKLNVSKNEDILRIAKVLNTENNYKEESFKNNIYIPKLEENDEIKKRLYAKEAFYSDEEAIKYGNDSIKLLYVPIFALIVSVISFLLNLVSVISILLGKLLKLNLVKRIGVNIVLLIGVTSLPLFNNSSILDNNIIKTAMNNDLSFYINFLNWVSYYEKLFN